MSKEIVSFSNGFTGTYTGKKINLLDPDPKDIDIMDIAHALSGIMRYNAYLKEPMCVAQHCVMVSYFPDEPKLQLQGLLHDAEEAYFVDLPRPIKYLPGFEEYRRLSSNFILKVYEKFGVECKEEFTPVVKLADNMSLIFEALHYMNHFPQWAQEIAGNNPTAYQKMCSIYAKHSSFPSVWDRQTAKTKFLERFYCLQSTPYVI